MEQAQSKVGWILPERKRARVQAKKITTKLLAQMCDILVQDKIAE